MGESDGPVNNWVMRRRAFLKRAFLSTVPVDALFTMFSSRSLGHTSASLAQDDAYASNSVLLDRNFGVKGDGRSNDTRALQRAIDAAGNKTLLITGQSRIDASGLDLRSGLRLHFMPGASLKLLPHSVERYQMFRIWEINNVFVKNAYLDGSANLSSAISNPSSGGYGMGISIAGSRDVNLISPKTINCWGDGIYISNGYFNKRLISRDIFIYGHYASHCRRQGVSVISVDGLDFVKPVWEDIGGTAPSAGLDIEPNSNDDVLQRIKIFEPKTRNCKTGILIALSQMPGSVRRDVDITIVRHRDQGSRVGFSVPGFKLNGYILKGIIASDDAVWSGNVRAKFLNKDYDFSGPQLIVSEAR